jgi:hypothetical protein
MPPLSSPPLFDTAQACVPLYLDDRRVDAYVNMTPSLHEEIRAGTLRL